MILIRLIRTIQYKNKPDARKHVVTFQNDKFRCNCLMSIYLGVPCRHEVVACVQNHNNYLKHLYFNNRWRLNYLKSEELKEEYKLPNMIEDLDEEILVNKLKHLDSIENPRRKGQSKKVKAESRIVSNATQAESVSEFKFLENSRRRSAMLRE
jgi:hypothetical protein